MDPAPRRIRHAIVARPLPFRDRRLYRKGAEFATYALDRVGRGFDASRWIARMGNGAPSLRFDTAAEGRALERRLDQALVDFASTLDRRHLAASLIQGCVAHYAAGNVRNAYLGPAMKTALVVGHRAGFSGTNRAHAAYWDLLEGCVLLNQVEHTVPVLEAYGDGRSEVLPHLIDHDPQLLGHRNLCDLILGSQQFVHRTAMDSVLALCAQPAEALDALAAVLLGAAPADQPAFRGTVFARLPSTAGALWIRLYARVHLSGLAQMYPAEHRLGDGWGLFVYAPFAAWVHPGLGPLIPEGIASLDWDAAWVSERSNHWRSNMIVERPVYALESELMATSVGMLLDSAGWMTEAALYHFADAREFWIDDADFAEAVSRPFELSVRAALAAAGWRVGHVNERGVVRWAAGGALALGGSCPGEIDAIATNGQRTWVIECKCLQMPFLVPGRLRDAVARLGPDDDQTYHAKAAKKADWLRTRLPGTGLGDEVRAVIVLDRPLPGMLDGGAVPVIAADSLVDFLARPEDAETRIPRELRAVMARRRDALAREKPARR